MARLADDFRSWGLISLGVILMMTPLALWVAWTGTMLLIVLATGTLAGVLYCVLAETQEPANLGQGVSPKYGPVESLPYGFVEALHEISPLTYHHRIIGSPIFQRKMVRLKELLNR